MMNTPQTNKGNSKRAICTASIALLNTLASDT